MLKDVCKQIESFNKLRCLVHEFFSRDHFEEAQRFGHPIAIGECELIRWFNLSADSRDDLKFGGILAGAWAHP